jgi:fluoride exporter
MIWSISLCGGIRVAQIHSRARGLMTLLTERFKVDPNWRFLLVVGFLGGYTTFSSLQWETFTSIRDGGLEAGLLNEIFSVILGYLAVWLGVTIVRG